MQEREHTETTRTYICITGIVPGEEKDEYTPTARVCSNKQTIFKVAHEITNFHTPSRDANLYCEPARFVNIMHRVSVKIKRKCLACEQSGNSG